MRSSKCNQPAQQLHQFFRRLPEQLGKASGFVQRRSKMTSTVFMQTLLLGWLHNPEASLRELSRWSRELGVEISPQGLDKRFNHAAVDLFEALLGEALRYFQQQQPLPISVLNQFAGIHILDSSYVVVPDHMQATFRGSGGNNGVTATAKIQLSFDYLRGCINTLDLGSAHIPDQKSTLHTQFAIPNSLHLFDLGYFKLSVFRELAHQQAYFISRFNTQCLIYLSADAEKAIALPTYLAGISEQRHETTLFIGAQERLPVRMLFEKAPESVAAERRRKAKRRGQRSQKPRTQRHLALLDWSIFITNVPPTLLDFRQVVLLYRVRWQIELLFKLWKSHLHLTALGDTWRAERVLCQLYAKMILMILFQWLIAPYRIQAETELSPVKALQLLQRYHVSSLLICLRTQRNRFQAWLMDFFSELASFASKSRRRKTPSTYHAILATTLPCLG